MTNLGLDVDHQLVKYLERFRLVLDQRIALAISAQTNAGAQAVHSIEVLLPQPVNRAENGVTLDGPELLRVLETDFQLVRFADFVRDELAHRELRGTQPVEDRPGHRLVLAAVGRLDNLGFRHAERESQVYPVRQAAHVPLAHLRVASAELLHFLQHDLLHDVHQPVAHVIAVNDLVAEAVNDFALLVHDVVVFERAFADLEVVLLDALLRLLDGTVQQRMGQLLALFQADPLHHFHDPVRTEQPHQIVFQRNEEMGRTGVALPRAASAQLAVNAAGFVAFGADDVQAARFRHAGAEFDVRATAGHVGRDGDGAALTGARDDFRFLLVILGIEHRMNNPRLLQQPREMLAHLHRNRADQNRPAVRVHVLDLLEHCAEFLAPGFIHRIVRVFARDRFVRRNDQHAELVDVKKLLRLSLGRAGHAGQLPIQAEIILNRDRRQRLGLALDLHAFLGFDRLMQAIAPAPAGH